MSENQGDPKKAGEGQCPDKQLNRPYSARTLSDSNERRQLAIRRLLETLPVDVDDKLVTLKVAHHVDKDRFQSALQSLMRNTKP